LADAVENMQQLGWLPFLDHSLWNTSTILSEDSSIGDVFHSLLGYADHPTVLQALVWTTFVAVTATLFIRTGRRARPSAAPNGSGTPVGVADRASAVGVAADDSDRGGGPTSGTGSAVGASPASHSVGGSAKSGS
jgi:hypothetical protein